MVKKDVLNLKEKYEKALASAKKAEDEYLKSILSEELARCNDFVGKAYVTKSGDDTSSWDEYLFAHFVNPQTAEIMCIAVSTPPNGAVIASIKTTSEQLERKAIEISKDKFVEEYNKYTKSFLALVKGAK